MNYLLDTNIVSELMKAAPDQGVIDWVNEHDADTVLCAVVLAEIASGIEALEEGKRKAALFKEVRFIQEDYRERILPFDEAAAWEWARYIRLTKDAAGLASGQTSWLFEAQLSNDLSNTANAAVLTTLPQTSANSNSVNTLGMSADSSYNQSQMDTLLQKMDELINTLRR